MDTCTVCGSPIEWVLDEGVPPFWCHVDWPADGHDPAPMDEVA